MIALVITIIVLLILAGVSVATLTGDNGLLIKTNKAKTETEITQVKEEVELAFLRLETMDDKSPEEKDNWLKEKLEGATITRYESIDTIIISYKGCDFIVDSENNLQLIRENIEEEKFRLTFLALKAMNDKTPEEKDNWLKEKLGGIIITRYEGVEDIIISYKGCKYRVDSESNLNLIENLDEWDATATPEDVFIWDENEPGTVVGYTKKAKDYTTLKYPSRCTKIDYAWNNGYSYVTQVEKIEIPSTVLTFAQYAFGGKSIGTTTFTGLKEVVIKDGVTKLSSYMFQYNSSLQSITIPEGITAIPACCFYLCTSLVEIELPDSITSIADMAFRECTSLTKINIPDGVTRIGHIAFAKCISIEKIVIPKSVVETAMEVFKNWGTGEVEQKIYVEAESMPSTWNRYTFNSCGVTPQYGYTGE